MKESQIEKYLKKEVEKLGGICWKFVSPGTAGVPDRIVITRNGRLVFVELKKGKEGKLSALQIFVHKKLRALNVNVEVVTSKEEVDEFIERVRESH